MENYLELFTKFFMLSFIKLEEESSNLVTRANRKFEKSKEAITKSKVKVALGNLGNNNKKLILVIKEFHDLIYLLHDVILKNQEKLLIVQSKIELINNHEIHSQFDKLVALFEKEVLNLEKTVDDLVKESQKVFNFNEIVKELNVDDKNFLNNLNTFNQQSLDYCNDFSEKTNAFKEKVTTLAKYENQVQELFNRVMTP